MTDSHDPQVYRLFLRVLGYKHLTARETKYLLIKFSTGYKDEQIAKWDSRQIGRAAINVVINNALRKIRKSKK